MRPSINEAVTQAQGDYLLKCDAHCQFAHGFDVEQVSRCDLDMVVVPRRYSLDAARWEVLLPEGARDYHYLGWPLRGAYLRKGEPVLRGWSWPERMHARASLLVDDEMTAQGSCWLMSRAQWERIGPLDVAHYGPFIQEFQEVGLKTWLGGGRVRTVKSTWYAHYYKRNGAGYVLSRRQSHAGIAYSFDHWFFDRPWPGKVRSFDWLIEQFWPLPGWPDDWRARRATYAQEVRSGGHERCDGLPGGDASRA